MSGATRKRSLAGRTVLASGMLAVVVGSAFAVLLLGISNLRSATERARRSQEVLAAANELERLVIDLETGLRGFVITGADRFLEPWETARRALPAQAAVLQRLEAKADGAQRARVRRIADLTNSYIGDYSIPTVEAARRDADSARTEAVTQEGKQRVDELRSAFNDFLAAERRQAELTEDRSTAAARRAIVAAAVGVGGSVVLAAVFSAYVTRAIVRPIRQAAGMASRLAGGDLSARMPESGPAEIGTLERAFNDMAGSLESSRAELAASRARVVAAADETRRRLERDLHDGTQQRLVSLALDVRAAESGVPTELSELRAQLRDLAAGLGAAVDELREMSRGLHPAILSRGGLGAALKTLVRRSAVPVRLSINADQRFPEAVEVAAYYVVSEALTNAIKHAGASVVDVAVDVDGPLLLVGVKDDGVGGADPARGSGLTGLRDRVESIGGTMRVTSPAGEGTAIEVSLPLGLAP